MPDRRTRRLAENQALFRDVNERIQSAARAQIGCDDHVYSYLCECSRESCAERVQLTLLEYERVRDAGRRFVVAPGHEIEHLEHVVERLTFGPLVVEKHGDARGIVEATDPRAA